MPRSTLHRSTPFPVPRIPGVWHRRVHPLAPELGLPPALRLRLLHERRGDVVDVLRDDVVLDHCVEPLAEIPLELHVADSRQRVAARRERDSRRRYRDHGGHGGCLCHIGCPFVCQKSRLRTLSALSSMNLRRGSTSSPMRSVNIWSAFTASSSFTRSMWRFSGFIVVS